MADGGRRIAIACQGGGSHTAFTAGVLARLLGAPELADHEVVAISGTSGGAICALLAWTALTDGDRDPSRAAALLKGFWAENSASTPVDAVTNLVAVWTSTLQNLGLAPTVSPYDVPMDALGTFRELLQRWVDFDAVRADPDGSLPMLLIGAVDVLSGEFRAFNSRRERISPECVLASAAIPTLFPAVETPDGGAFWDGLFSQNPPVRELLEADPDELWVIQINPTRTDKVPRSVLDIADRRNELAGNLSLYQELHVIEKIDQLLADGLLAADRGYKQVVVRVLEFARSRSSRRLGPASKINRDPGFLTELIAQGERQAEEFLGALTLELRWRAGDADGVLALLAEDAELSSADPFPHYDRVRGAELADAVRDLVSRQARIDLTRKQLVGDRVTWTLRAQDGGSAPLGHVEVQLSAGRPVRLSLGSGSTA